MIVGFSLRHVEAEQNAPMRGDVNVNYDHNVEDVEEAEVAAIDDTVARVEFSLNISYRQNEEEAAYITFEGNVLWKENADRLLDRWEEDEVLDDTVGPAIANHVFRKCVSQATGLADTLDIPAPVPMPKIEQ